MRFSSICLVLLLAGCSRREGFEITRAESTHLMIYGSTMLFAFLVLGGIALRNFVNDSFARKKQKE